MMAVLKRRMDQNNVVLLRWKTESETKANEHITHILHRLYEVILLSDIVL